MSTLEYDREALKDAVIFLLDRAFGKGRTEHVREFVKGERKSHSWFCGKRTCLRVLLYIAKQEGGAPRVLDLLDRVDARREGIEREGREELAQLFKSREISATCARRYRIRCTAAIMSEEIRREKAGEPELNAETTAAFLERRRAYWNRRIDEYIKAAVKPGYRRKFSDIRHEASDVLYNEELDKLERMRNGILELSSAAIRRLNEKSNLTVARRNVNTALAERKK